MVTGTPKIRNSENHVIWARGAKGATQISRLLDFALPMSNARVQARLLQSYARAIRAKDCAQAVESFNALCVTAQAIGGVSDRQIIGILGMNL